MTKKIEKKQQMLARYNDMLDLAVANVCEALAVMG